MPDRVETLTQAEADALFAAANDAGKHLWLRRDYTALRSAIRKFRRATVLRIEPEDTDA